MFALIHDKTHLFVASLYKYFTRNDGPRYQKLCLFLDMEKIIKIMFEHINKLALLILTMGYP